MPEPESSDRHPEFLGFGVNVYGPTPYSNVLIYVSDDRFRTGRNVRLFTGNFERMQEHKVLEAGHEADGTFYVTVPNPGNPESPYPEYFISPRTRDLRVQRYRFGEAYLEQLDPTNYNIDEAPEGVRITRK